MHQIVTRELIFSYFMGNASAIQRQTIAQWAREKSNEEQFYRWLEEFETLHPEYDADLENGVRKYYAFLSEAVKGSVADRVAAERAPDLVPERIRWLRWGAAAGIALLLGLTVFPDGEGWRYKTYRTRVGERKDFILPDGSSVSLRSNSQLKISSWSFGSESRDVYLSGEASFQVTHAPDNKRFVVKTLKHFEVEVLGTEFNVVARETGSRVILRKGRVQINFHMSKTPHALDLKPGDVFMLDSRNKTSLKTTTVPEMREAWQGHLYVFDKTSLTEIMSRLREDHGIEAEFADAGLADHTVSGKFTAENIDELFELIQDILDIQITRHGDRVTISKPH
ncbi:FecR family protein [Ravibacter arvi]|uniref:FecR family protein n=1 Tax=Ravibacter arvi TaxID=2051041 RepID=A0ABP8LQ92_9BACT